MRARSIVEGNETSTPYKTMLYNWEDAQTKRQPVEPQEINAPRRVAVLAVDDRPIDTLPAFMGSLYLHPVDRVLKLDVLRDTGKITLNIPVLQEKHPMDQLLDLADPQNNLVPQLAILAISIDERVQPMVGQLRFAGGVLVLGRAADLLGPDIGLAAGDVIHSVNNRPVDTIENLRSSLSQLKSGDSVALQVERGGKLQFVSFELD